MGVKTAEEKRGRQIVVNIKKAKRLPYSLRPETEPPREMASLFLKEVPENDRAILTENDMRADINDGDPGLVVLKKCRFVLENVDASFKDSQTKELLICRVVKVMMDYGESEAVVLLNEALSRFGHMKSVREAVSVAISRIGAENDLVMILSSLEKDLSSPEAHLSALVHFAVRYPEKAGDIVKALERLGGPEKHFKAIVDEVLACAPQVPSSA